ncbi:hypothetical protein M409DRAFT_51836 [Zasmidium cellare ATCC 36951]|uniref:MARVEL domain-containing protein n=1 Tax=Zasmidium cellare ATCC 36951 TaxID=1080233 RepID=A0A6A6CW98_ZASCE|nr:uncharacterized protein M409DRAFT_51836 [Zasmidium cellare ATCC 36951]KAF2170069.1 hypothetical protein M409DRAFT_51836 [Zasmidium cellare ATCC 36951]
MAVDFYTWLTTFQNQRHVAHTACILLSAGLLFTGFGAFILNGFGNTNFDDFEGEKRRTMLTWLTGAVGMMATAANVFLYSRIAVLDRFDPLATEESMSIKRTTTCIVGVIGLFVVTVVEFALAGATAREGFTFIALVATFAGCISILTMAYDIISLVRPNRISLDDETNVPLEHDEFDP